MTATNADGTSDPAFFTIAVKPGSYVPPSSQVEILWDLDTKAVTFAGFTGTEPPLLKLNDKVVFAVRAMKAGVAADLDLSALRFGLKFEEDSSRLIVGDVFKKIGTGPDTYYRLYVDLEASNTALAEELDAHTAKLKVKDIDALPVDETPKREAAIIAIAEFEAVEVNPYYSGTPHIGGSTLRFSSRTFPVRVARDLN